MTDKAIRAAKLTIGGMLEKNRAKEAVDRAGGQIAPSKYMPGVPRQVHKDGGKVTFMQGNHPLVPDVLYHGNALKIATKGWTDEVDPEQTAKNIAAQNFITFKPSEHGNYGPGIYLSDSPKVASDFAQGIRADRKEAMPFGQVMKLHVSMKQPFTDDVLRHPAWMDYIKKAITRHSLPHSEDRNARDAFLKKLDDGTATVRDMFVRDTPHGTMVNQWGHNDIHDTIRRSGFDGIIAHRPDGSKEYVAFHPTQVKSAIGNRGTFDPADPDMTRAEGGRIGKAYGGSYVPQAFGQPAPQLAVAAAPAIQRREGQSTLETLASFAPEATPAAAPTQTPTDGVSASAQAALDALRKNWTGQAFNVISDYRDPNENQRVGGAKGSQHLSGNAFDIDTHGWMPEQKLALATEARNAGFNGFGFYDNNMHFDVGPARTWGPSYHHDSVPEWAQGFANGGRIGKADGGSITAYHGSPHSFDKFDISKIGTGEGAQSYGHGLYFAANEKVAKGYRDTLTDSENSPLHFDQRPVNTPWNEEIRARWPEHFTGKSKRDQDAMEEALGNLSQVNRMADVPNAYSNMSSAAKYMYQRHIRPKLTKPDLGKGHMYKVNLHVKPDELLDWDKPLSEQPEVARRLGYADPEEIKRQKDLHYSKFKPSDSNSFDDLFGPLDQEEKDAAEALSKMPESWGNMTGKVLHDILVNRTGSKKGAADAMQDAGLKGIKYRDAGSRYDTDGDPTHNYVMFHHDPVEVTDKYAYGGKVDVSRALAMTRRFTKDGKAATMALKSKGN